MNKGIIASVAVCLSLFLIPCHSTEASEQIELKFQSSYSPTQVQTTQVLDPWITKVKELSGGSINIKTFPMDSIVKIAQSHHAIQEGLLDLALCGDLAPKEGPYTMLFGLPGAVKGPRHGSFYWDKVYSTVPEFKQEIDRYGLPVCFFSAAQCVIASVNSPIRTPSDLKGKRVLFNMPADSKMIEAWGGIPVIVSPPDTYVGLQRGMGECIYIPISLIKRTHIMELIKYETIARYLEIIY